MMAAFRTIATRPITWAAIAGTTQSCSSFALADSCEEKALLAFATFTLHWPEILFFREDSPSVEQVGVRESPLTSHHSRCFRLAALCSPVERVLGSFSDRLQTIAQAP